MSGQPCYKLSGLEFGTRQKSGGCSAATGQSASGVSIQCGKFTSIHCIRRLPAFPAALLLIQGSTKQWVGGAHGPIKDRYMCSVPCVVGKSRSSCQLLIAAADKRWKFVLDVPQWIRSKAPRPKKRVRLLQSNACTGEVVYS